jgi:hypothetical protein
VRNKVQTPIPLQKIKRQGNRAATSGEIGGTPEPVNSRRPPGDTGGGTPGPEPILLTRRKDRKRTLPLEIEINSASPVVTPTPTPMAIAPQVTGEIWSDDDMDDDAHPTNSSASAVSSTSSDDEDANGGDADTDPGAKAEGSTG